MAKTRAIRLSLLVFGLSVCAAAQSSSQSQPQPETTPAPAFGQTAPVLNPENPPVSGLDEPRLELHTPTRSFISPALLVSESGDSNGSNQLGSAGPESITRVLGALDLQQFWPKSDLFLEYLGGGAFYSSPFDMKQLQAAGLEAVTRWRTGQATLRDSFSYLPDGAFQVGVGGVPGFGLASGGGGMVGGVLPGSEAINGSVFGSVGNIPRLANTAILDAVQTITPISALTLASAFSNAHFYDPTNTFINSDQFTIEGGYSRLLSHHDQIGAVYAYQLFQFPQYSGGQIYVQVANLRWSHVISGRMTLVAGAGPEYTDLEEGGYYQHWSLSARVQLNYQVGRGSMSASYEKFTSTGSGIFFGANTQSAMFRYTRPLGRTWTFNGFLGYSHDTRIEFVAVNASTYNEGFAGTVLRKHLGRTLDFLVAYHFSEVGFNAPISLGGSTGSIGQRQSGTIGLEWHPRPTRIE